MNLISYLIHENANEFGLLTMKLSLYRRALKGNLTDLCDKAFYTQQNHRFERTITRVKAGISEKRGEI